MGVADDLAGSRRRLRERADAVGRAAQDRPPSATALVGTVTGVAGTATAPVTVGVHPTYLGGTGVLGSAVTLDQDTDTTVPIDLTRGSVVNGDVLVARYWDGRWVAEKRGRSDCIHQACVGFFDRGTPVSGIAYRVKYDDHGTVTTVASGTTDLTGRFCFTFTPTDGSQHYDVEYDTLVTQSDGTYITTKTIKFEVVPPSTSACNISKLVCPLCIVAVACCNTIPAHPEATITGPIDPSPLTFDMMSPFHSTASACLFLPAGTYDVTVTDPDQPTVVTKSVTLTCLTLTRQSVGFNFSTTAATNPDIPGYTAPCYVVSGGPGGDVTLNAANNYRACKLITGVTKGFVPARDQPCVGSPPFPDAFAVGIADEDCNPLNGPYDSIDVPVLFETNGCVLRILVPLCRPTGCSIYLKQMTCADLLASIVGPLNPLTHLFITLPLNPICYPYYGEATAEFRPSCFDLQLWNFDANSGCQFFWAYWFLFGSPVTFTVTPCP